VGTPGVCDGNGDGNIDSGNASQAQERFQFWRHLQQAGLVEGSLSGSAGSGAANHMIVGTNVPPSKLGAAGWSPGGRYDNTGASGTIDFYINYGQHFLFGGMNANSSLRASALKPEEAWNIDTKLDDGKPARGKVVSPQWTTCTNAADGSVLAADYALNANTIACILMFPNAF
jgi:hypothetical protein